MNDKVTTTDANKLHEPEIWHDPEIWPDNVAMKDQNLANIVDLIRYNHPNGCDENITRALSFDLEKLQPDTLGAIVGAIGNLQALVEQLEQQRRRPK